MEQNAPAWQVVKSFFITSFAKEGERKVFWYVVFYGAGIGIFFLYPLEFMPLLIALLISRIISHKFHYHISLFLILGAIRLWTEIFFLNTQMIKQEEELYITGTLEGVERTSRGYRLILDQVFYKGSQIKIRLHHLGTKMSPDLLRQGNKIGMWALLRPISGPLYPGGFNFKRKAFFEGISATGETRGKITLNKKSNTNTIASIRQKITTRIFESLPKETAPIAAALLTGEKLAIPKKIRQAYVGAGLAHLLAISGLHLSMVAGLIFIVVRFLLCLSQRFCLLYPIKKIAAVVSGFVAFYYLLISGGAVPALRAFLMVCFFLMAILVERVVLTMRSVIIAAFIVLTLMPHALVMPSFQLSFAAVVGLIAFYEWYQKRNVLRTESWGAKFKNYFVSIFLTSLVASIVTMPFTLYHFGSLSLQSITGNLLAIPVMGFYAMPCGVGALILFPFGLERVPLVLMSKGIEVLNAIAEKVSSLPGSFLPFPGMSLTSLLLIVFGGLWLLLWQERWRALGVVPIIAGLFFFETPADILLSPEKRLVGVRLKQGLAVNRKRDCYFIIENWKQAQGVRQEMLFPYGGVLENLNCREDHCVYQKRGYKIIFLNREKEIRRVCRGGEGSRTEGSRQVDFHNNSAFQKTFYIPTRHIKNIGKCQEPFLETILSHPCSTFAIKLDKNKFKLKIVK